MEKLLDRLITVIGDEATLFEQFLELLERQQNLLIANDADSIQEVTGRLQIVAMESRRLEEERAGVVEEIRRANNTEDDLTVARICDIADETRSSHLKLLRETVLNLYSRIEETRMRNALLIRQSLEQIQNTVETIGRIPAQKEIYQGRGGLARSYSPIGVDRRV